MTTEEVKHNLANKWKTYLSLIVCVGVIGTGIKTWADERYDQSEDISEIKDNVEFTLHLTLEDRIVRLDNRIQGLERLTDPSSDQRQTLNELRLKRHRLRERLRDLDGNG